MNKSTAIAIEPNELKRQYAPLVDPGYGYYVLVSHTELDALVGRLMQIFDLNGDVEQRNALKSETKQRCREWLDNAYKEAGYDKWTGLEPGIKPISIGVPQE